jgi:3',5'-cyclic AMP phosphodiesterase CpdA
VIAPGLPDPAQDPDVCVVLHLSDPHFGTEDACAVQALLALGEQERPDVVVASGDITQRARSREFDAALRFFSRLAARHLLVVPGSHDMPLWDLPRRLLAPFSGFRRVFGDNLEPRLASPFVWIAALVSARRWRHKHGALSLDQVQRTAQWLACAPSGALRVVVTHHPLAALRWHEEDEVVAGAQQALSLWSQAGVHLVLGGHTHTPYTVPVRADATGSGRALWVAQAGSAVSRRLHAGGTQSVNLLRRGVAGVWRIEQWDLQREAGLFAQQHWREVGGEHAGHASVGIGLRTHGGNRPVHRRAAAQTMD